MAFEYLPGRSIMHRLDPRIKLLWLATNILLGAFLFDPILLALVYSNVLILALVSKIPREKLTGMFIGLAPVMVVYFVLNLWWVRGETVFFQLLPSNILGGYIVSLEGIVFSLGVIARFVLMVTSYRVLTLTTTVTDYVLGLVKLRLPKEFGVALSIGFSYIPVLVAQVSSIMDAQKARGWVFEYSNPIKRVRALIPTLFPVIMTSVRRGYNIAAAIESKGFGNITRRTYMHELRFKSIDYVAGAICAVAIAVGYYISSITPYPGIVYTLGIIRQLFQIWG